MTVAPVLGGHGRAGWELVARKVMLLALLVALSTLVACGTGGTTSGYEAPSPGARPPAPRETVQVPPEDRPSSVAMVGDSITLSARDELVERLHSLGLDVVAVDADEGRRMTVGVRGRVAPGDDVVTFITAADAPELWVVALGTNDIGQYRETGQVAEQVDAVLRAIPDDVPVVWVDTFYRDRPFETALVNEGIRRVVERRPRSVVVAWSAVADDEGVLVGDGVHLTDRAGRARFADTVADAVRELIG